MKKQILLLLLLTNWLPTIAQDTIDRPPKNYYYECWIGDVYDLLENNAQIATGDFVACMPQDGSYPDAEIAIPFSTDGPLIVYGIAAGLRNGYEDHLDWQEAYIFDTSHYSDSCYEYLRIYKREGNNMHWLKQAKVHYSGNPSHILDLPSFDTILTPKGVRGIYEAYFDEPVTITDSFYLGMTQRTHRYEQDSVYDVILYGYTWPIYLTTLTIHQIIWGLECVNYNYASKDKPDGWHFWEHGPEIEHYGSNAYHLIFPILTPSPYPHSGIGKNKGFHVDISPNPTCGVTSVTSSSEMGCIEVYNSTGYKTLSIPTTGTSATIDTRGWRTGVYIIHLHTHQGTLAKKLLVQ